MSELARAQVDESEVNRNSKSEEQILVLVRRAQSEDQDAFTAIVEIFKIKITAFVNRTLQYCADVDDIVQETFISAHKHIARFRFESKFSTWLFTIARNKCNDYISKKCRLQEASIPLDEVRDCAARNGWNESRAIAKIIKEKVVPQMAPMQQEIVARIFDGQRTAEIAADLKTNQQKIRDTMRAFLDLVKREVENF